MRLFIAINFTDATRSRLVAVAEAVRQQAQQGNFSRPENLHITLAFLGECSPAQLASAQTVLDETSFPPFTVTVEKLGRFKRPGGEIWWAGLKPEPVLLALQADVSRRLIQAGFKLEDRPFSPHITLCREILAPADFPPLTAFSDDVTSIDLMKSERLKGQLTYTAIHRRLATGGSGC